MRTVLRIVRVLLTGVLIWGCSKRGGIEASAMPPSPTECQPAESMQLNIPLKPQENGAWCWAAAAQMVLASPALKIFVSQCDVASRQFGSGGHCCSAAGVPDTC